MSKKLDCRAILFIIIALISLLGPELSVQATTESEMDMSDRCGLKPMEYVELPEEFETTAETLKSVYVSDSDIAYWSKFSNDYFYNTLNDVEKISELTSKSSFVNFSLRLWCQRKVADDFCCLYLKTLSKSIIT